MFSPCVIKNAMANNMTTSHTGSIKVQLRRPMHVDPPKALVYSYLEGGREGSPDSCTHQCIPGGGSGKVGTRVSFTSVTGKRSGQSQNPASADEKALLCYDISLL